MKVLFLVLFWIKVNFYLINCIDVEIGPPNANNFIFNGNVASIQNFPYQLSLRRNGIHMCGAVIIGSQWALTAAHCLLGTPPLQVSFRAGSDQRNIGGTLLNGQGIYIHPDFNPFTMDNDIALVQILETFSGTNIQPIFLDVQGTIITAGTVANMTGWGITRPGDHVLATFLKVVEVPIVEATFCNSILQPYGGITSGMICTGGTIQDFCHGDFGGPLVTANRLVGIASWNPLCGDSTRPSVYVRIAAPIIRHFIRTVAGI